MATALSRANGVPHKNHSCPHAANHKPEDARAACAAGPHQVTAHSGAVGRLHRPAGRPLLVRRLHKPAAAASCCEDSPAPSCTPADIATPPLDEYPPTYVTAPGRIVASAFYLGFALWLAAQESYSNSLAQSVTYMATSPRPWQRLRSQACWRVGRCLKTLSVRQSGAAATPW